MFASSRSSSMRPKRRRQRVRSLEFDCGSRKPLATAVGGRAWQVVRPGRQPGVSVVAVPLVTDDDLIMAHVGVTASLIPGSLVLETDRDRRILYLHVIGVADADAVEKQRASVLRWEARIVRAVGSRAQLRAVRQAPGSHTKVAGTGSHAEGGAG